jgi:hypothetical protein
MNMTHFHILWIVEGSRSCIPSCVREYLQRNSLQPAQAKIEGNSTSTNKNGSKQFVRENALFGSKSGMPNSSYQQQQQQKVSLIS